MPIYEITVTDKNKEEVIKKVIHDLKLKKAQNEQIKRKRSLRVFNKAYERVMNVPLTIEIEYKQIAENKIEVALLTTAMVKDKVFDKAINGLKDFGEMEIVKKDV